jgi:hypothetical protein
VSFCKIFHYSLIAKIFLPKALAGLAARALGLQRINQHRHIHN